MKKVFIWGDYDAFSVGNLKYYKEKNDFLLISVKVSKDFRSQTQTVIDGIKPVKNVYAVSDFATMSRYLKEEKPDFLCITTGHSSLERVEDFNKTKFLCDELGIELGVIHTFKMDYVTCVNPMNIYDTIRQQIKKEVLL
jgi:hypothetical protein